MEVESIGNDMNRLVESDLDTARTLTAETARDRYSLVVQALVNIFAGRLRMVLLFGSQARGGTHPNSDHDLYVVVEDLPVDPLARQRVVRKVLLPILDRLPGPINFVGKTPKEVAANLTPLLLDVCVDGVCLYATAYFEPYRQRALAALRQSKLRRQRLGGTLMWLFDELPATNWELSWEGYLEYV